MGRKSAKHVGVATPAALKKVVNGTELRDLQSSPQGQELPILPDPPSPEAPGDGASRVFGGLPREGANSPLVDARLRAAERETESLNVDEIIKRIAAEDAGEDHQDTDTRMSNLEVLVRRFFESALSGQMGSQRAREYLLDRLAGKAGRAAPVQGTNTELEDQLDRTAVSLLNDLAKKED